MILLSSYNEVFEEFGYNDYGFDTSVFENMDFSFLGVALGVILVIFGVILLIALILKLLEIIGFWKIFNKAGESGWASIIPIYNYYIKAKIGGAAWWWILLVYIGKIVSILGVAVSGGLSLSIGLVTLFGKFIIHYNICKKFGKDAGFAVLLTLFPFIGALILGGKNSVYDENIVTSEYGIFGENK